MHSKMKGTQHEPVLVIFLLPVTILSPLFFYCCCTGAAKSLEEVDCPHVFQIEIDYNNGLDPPLQNNNIILILCHTHLAYGGKNL